MMSSVTCMIYRIAGCLLQEKPIGSGSTASARPESSPTREANRLWQYCKGALRGRPCAHARAGKNRPLDEDERHFIDAVEAQQRDRERGVRAEEAAALDAYQQAGRRASYVLILLLKIPIHSANLGRARGGGGRARRLPAGGAPGLLYPCDPLLKHTIDCADDRSKMDLCANIHYLRFPTLPGSATLACSALGQLLISLGCLRMVLVSMSPPGSCCRVVLWLTGAPQRGVARLLQMAEAGCGACAGGEGGGRAEGEERGGGSGAGTHRSIAKATAAKTG